MMPRISSLLALTFFEGIVSSIFSKSMPLVSPSMTCLPDLPNMSERTVDSLMHAASSSWVIQFLSLVLNLTRFSLDLVRDLNSIHDGL